MKLASTSNTRATISLVPLVDVMLILLIFFMVTSTYLNLDMIPVVDRAEDSAGSVTTAGNGGVSSSTLLLRLGPDGQVYYRGQIQSGDSISAIISNRLADQPETAVVVLPSGGASMQALVNLMETAARSGAGNLRVMRLETRP